MDNNIVVYSKAENAAVGSITTLYFVDADQNLVEFRKSIVYENG